MAKAKKTTKQAPIDQVVADEQVTEAQEAPAEQAANDQVVAEQITEAQEAPAEQAANDQVVAEQITKAQEAPAEQAADGQVTAKKDAKKSAVLEVTAKSDQGRWRAGFRFSRTPTRLPLSDLNAEQISALKADPMLSVKES